MGIAHVMFADLRYPHYRYYNLAGGVTMGEGIWGWCVRGWADVESKI